MPRPRKMKEWNCRVTPPLGMDLVFPTDQFEQFISCKEYGKINGKKHYHLYCKTTLNDDEVRKYLRDICGVDKVEGNDLYAVTPAHEGTLGYIVKEEDVITSKGFTEDQLSQLIERSRQYRRDLEAQRKKTQRSKEANNVQICKEVCDQIRLESFMQSGTTLKCQYKSLSKEELAAVVLDRLMSKLDSEDELSTPRSTMERMIITCMKKLGNKEWIREYYIPRCFQNSFSQY